MKPENSETAVAGRVRHIFISSGHNFFGRHGQAPGNHPIAEVDAVACVAGQGLAGDRFFNYKDEYKGQVTFFAWETFRALLQHLGREGVSPAVLRRNVITEGMDLPALIGHEYELQGIRFEGTEECRPCYWMDHALAPGAEAALKGRGGLRARILTSGTLRKNAS